MTDSGECPTSKRPDGKHGWRFDGDDPYVICVFCEEVRDALSGRTLRLGRGAFGSDGAA